MHINHHLHIAITQHACPARNSAVRYVMELIMGALCDGTADDGDDVDDVMCMCCVLMCHIPHTYM